MPSSTTHHRLPCFQLVTVEVHHTKEVPVETNVEKIVTVPVVTTKEVVVEKLVEKVDVVTVEKIVERIVTVEKVLEVPPTLQLYHATFFYAGYINPSFRPHPFFFPK